MRRWFITLATFIMVLYGCKATQKRSTDTTSISTLRFLDEYVIPHNQEFKNTWIGGLSGIDYDQKNNRYFIISDERSATSPSRFYTANININNNKIDTVVFTSVHALLQPNGITFPSLKIDAVNAADPESIRYNAVKNNLIWTSEGDKAVRNGTMNIRSPWVYEMELDGQFRDSFLLPPIMQMQMGEAGPRVNGVFEGATFDGDKKYLYVNLEEPLYEDGPRADTGYAGAAIRIIKFDVVSKKPTNQYAYLLDAVADMPQPQNAFRVNGVPEILWIEKNKFLFIERSFSQGAKNTTIKVFWVDISKATDVSKKGSLKNKNFTPATKQLLFNFNSLNRAIDNIEGVTLGPILPNGRRSLLFIADNNFQFSQQSQVFLFEILP